MEGACGGSAACSTCHVIVVDQEMYDRLPEIEDDENDMLDLAFGLTETCVYYTREDRLRGWVLIVWGWQVEAGVPG